MNEQEPEALPGHAIGLAAEFEWKARQCRVLGNDRTFVEADLLDAAAAELRLLHPFPEPDHSMCARLVPHPDDPRNRHGLQSPNGSYLTLPHDGPVFVAPDDYWRERGYAIPEPEPTVMERAAEVLNHVDLRGNDLGTVFAEALDAAGLLVRDGEQ